MVASLIAVASVLAYFALGFTVATRRRAVMWAKARKAWHFEDSIAGSVKAQFICTILAWWVYLPVAWLSGMLGDFTVAGDPEETARVAAERKRYIAQLEAENERLRRQQEGRLS